MRPNFKQAVSLLAMGAAMAAAFPAATEVEILKSEEVPLKETPDYTLQQSEKQLLSLTDLPDDGIAENIIPVDDRGKRMLNYIQTVLQNILKPQPIIDTITEEEKYGNTGDTLGAVGRGIVGTSEAISSFVSSAIEYPRNVFKSLLHRVTEALNHLGSKLVGL